MPPTEVPLHRVQALLERWFPGEPVATERMGSGVSTPVYRITSREAVRYLRLAEGQGEVRDGEVRAHDLAGQRGVRVPEVLRWEAHPPELDRSAMLTSELAGVPLSASGGEASSAVQGWVRDGALLNTISVRGWGWITGVSADGGLLAEHSNRSAWAEEYRTSLQVVLGTGLFSDAAAGALSRLVLAWCDLPGEADSWLAHGDLDPSHVYVDAETGAYMGLIDLGEIRGADALYDLGHALAHAFDARDQALAEAFLQERARQHGLDREAVRGQALAIATRALAIQLGRAKNGYRVELIARLGDLLECDRAT